MTYYALSSLGDWRLLQNDVDSVFSRAFSGDLCGTDCGTGAASDCSAEADRFLPAFDIHEDDTAIRLYADLPGVGRDAIKVSVENRLLTVHGQRATPSVENGKFRLGERSFGRFQRRFTLPTSIDSTQIRADYKDGVLTLTLPKLEQAKPRSIEIAVN